MSAEGIRLATLKIADDMIALANAILEDDSISTNTKIGRNTLKNSILRDDLAVTIGQSEGYDPVIKTLFNNYVPFIEWDRPPMYGKKPPIDVLKDWAAKNNIPTDADTLWRISYAIWRDGHVGRPIFATMDTELDGLYMNDWAPQLLNATLDNLDKFFND